jgi:hypothetical protein
MGAFSMSASRAKLWRWWSNDMFGGFGTVLKILPGTV